MVKERPIPRNIDRNYTFERFRITTNIGIILNILNKKIIGYSKPSKKDYILF
jgi:ADP-dependent phosphofructokinase/glucokinase